MPIGHQASATRFVRDRATRLKHAHHLSTMMEKGALPCQNNSSIVPRLVLYQPLLPFLLARPTLLRPPRLPSHKSLRLLLHKGLVAVQLISRPVPKLWRAGVQIANQIVLTIVTNGGYQLALSTDVLPAMGLVPRTTSAAALDSASAGNAMWRKIPQVLPIPLRPAPRRQILLVLEIMAKDAALGVLASASSPTMTGAMRCSLNAKAAAAVSGLFWSQQHQVLRRPRCLLPRPLPSIPPNLPQRRVPHMSSKATNAPQKFSQVLMRSTKWTPSLTRCLLVRIHYRCLPRVAPRVQEALSYPRARPMAFLQLLSPLQIQMQATHSTKLHWTSSTDTTMVGNGCARIQNLLPIVRQRNIASK